MTPLVKSSFDIVKKGAGMNKNPWINHIHHQSKTTPQFETYPYQCKIHYDKSGE